MACFGDFNLPQQEKFLNLYQSHFDLDEKSVKEIAKNLGIFVEEIKSFIKSLNLWLLVKDDRIAVKVNDQVINDIDQWMDASHVPTSRFWKSTSALYVHQYNI